jgi:hypothetical protein
LEYVHICIPYHYKTQLNITLYLGFSPPFYTGRTVCFGKLSAVA